MATRFDSSTIAAYDRVQTALESLRIAAGALTDQVAALAAGQECQSEGLDEFGRPNNTVADLLADLKRDLVQRIYQAKEAVHADLHAASRRDG